MEISESKSFASFTTAGVIAAVIYAVTVGPPPEGEVQLVSEMAAWEKLVLGYGLVAVFINVFVAAFDAFTMGRKGWGWLSILAWPVSFAFVWLSAIGYFRGQRRARGT
jgi:hypothetical protein